MRLEFAGPSPKRLTGKRMNGKRQSFPGERARPRRPRTRRQVGSGFGFASLAIASHDLPLLYAGGPRVRPHCRFRNRATDHHSEYGIKWTSGGATRQRDRTLGGLVWGLSMGWAYVPPLANVRPPPDEGLPPFRTAILGPRYRGSPYNENAYYVITRVT
jgi:hypothetical protein